MSEETLSHSRWIEEDRYRWIEKDRWAGNCISFVKSSDEDEVLRCFGGDLATAVRMTLDEAIENEVGAGGNNEYNSFVLAGTIGDWIILIEECGWQGTRPEVWQRASQGTEMVSLFWNGDGDNLFIYAVDGAEVLIFNLTSPEERYGSDPDLVLDYMLELPFSEDRHLPSPSGSPASDWNRSGFGQNTRPSESYRPPPESQPEF